MELRHLRYFVAVAEELHVGRAARRLHMAQPPLSRQIHDLEREVGVPLLEKVGRGIALTDAGRVFLEGARRALAEADAAAHAARRADRGEIGSLALGFVGSAAYATLPRLLRAFRAACPEVEMRVQSMITQEQVAALQAGRIQAGLLRPPIGDAALSLHPLQEEQLLVALPTDHPLAGLDRVPLAALAEESFILYPRADGPGVHDTMLSLCREAGFSPHIVQESGEMQTIAGLVAGGLGVALVIGDLHHIRNTGVAYRRLVEETPPWHVSLAWRHDDTSPVLRRLVEVAREVESVTMGGERPGDPEAAKHP